MEIVKIGIVHVIVIHYIFIIKSPTTQTFSSNKFLVNYILCVIFIYVNIYFFLLF